MESGLELGLAGGVGDAGEVGEVGAGVGLRPGSRADFDRLYLACHPRLVRTLTGILGDVSAAEDCTQDAFVRAWKAWPRWRPQAPAEAWLYRIALNVAFSHRRRQKLGYLVDRVLSRSAPDLDPGLIVRPDIAEALKRLPAREAAAVMLRHYHGYSRKEVAEMLGLTERAVSMRLSRARAILLQELGEEANHEPRLHPRDASAVCEKDSCLDRTLG
jgi:RNA polymerase sigma-70 factor (ECF subfamily)